MSQSITTTIKNDHGKVKVKNGNGRTRLKRRKTGRVRKKVKQSRVLRPQGVPKGKGHPIVPGAA